MRAALAAAALPALLALGLAAGAAPARAAGGCEVLSRGHWADPQGTATLAQAMEQRFEPVGAVLNQGYDRGAHWLRLQLRCAPDAVLRLPPAFLDRIDVYQRGAEGVWQVQHRGDTSTDAQAAWPATPRVGLLASAPAGAADAAGEAVYIRLETTSAALVEVQVLAREAADRLDSAETAAIWGYLGAVFALTAWVLLAVHRRERPLVASFITYQLCGAVVVLALTGQLAALWPALAPAPVGHVLGSLAVIASAAAGAWFCRLLLAPGRPRWVRWLPGAAAALLGACAIAFMAGAQREALHSVQWVVAALGAWCVWVALARPPGAPPQDGLHRLSFALIGAIGLLTAGRLLGGWSVGGASAYGASLNFGITALVMFSLLVVRDRRGRAADRQLRRGLAVERALARERSEQLESKTQLLAMLEHELKSPLTVLQFALANVRAAPGDVARDAVRDMVEIVERTVQIDRLDAGAWKLGATQLLRLQPWLDALCRSLRERTPSALPAVLSVPAGLAISSDELSLRIIVGNLIDNAYRYGGAQQPAQVDAQIDDTGTLRLRVANGVGRCGRPDPARLFERYYRAPGAERVRGAGLGLWLARALARRLGGDLRQLDDDSARITLELWLPTSPLPTPPISPARTSAQTPAKTG